MFFSLASLPFLSSNPLSVALLAVMLAPMVVGSFHDQVSTSSAILDNTASTLLLMSLGVLILSVQAQVQLTFFSSMLMTSLGLFFCSSSLISLYFWFEAVLLILIVLILWAGGQPERGQAVTFLVTYTVILSLPFLIVVAFLGPISFCGPLKDLSSMGLIIALAPMLVKLPLWGLHKWLAKAHVEAPLIGSMILAASLLKMGGYGLWRVLFLASDCSSLGPTSCWGLCGGLFASVACLYQSDVKAFVAYSSVAHMGLVVACLCNLSHQGAHSALLIMIGHGFTSSALFFCANAVYSQVSSRNILLMRGGNQNWLACLFAAVLLGSFGFPLTLNFFGEMESALVLSNVTSGFALFVGVFLFLAAAYHFILYTKLFHGTTASAPNYISTNLIVGMGLHALAPTWALLFVFSLKAKGNKS